MLLISNINPKFGSRFNSVPMFAVKLDLKEMVKAKFLPILAKKMKKIKHTSKLYRFSSSWHAQDLNFITYFRRIIFSSFWLLHIQKHTMLLGMDSVKPNNMVAAKKDSGWIGRIVLITQIFQYGQIFSPGTLLCSFKESYCVWVFYTNKAKPQICSS